MSHYYTEKNEDVKSNLQTIKVKFLDNIYCKKDKLMLTYMTQIS